MSGNDYMPDYDQVDYGVDVGQNNYQLEQSTMGSVSNYADANYGNGVSSIGFSSDKK